MNKLSLWNKASKGPATVCEIFSVNDFVGNLTVAHDVVQIPLCVEKLSFSTFISVYEICISYGIIYAIFSLIINYTGKLILLVGVLVPCGISAFTLIFFNQPVFTSYLYIFMILAGLGISIVNASTVELFPTNMRAMAVCLSMMVGRIGTVVGSTVIGAVIDQHCDLTFLMPTFLLLTSAVLAFTIPNIGKRIK
jgi:MFS transporter, VNT family, synaptic vesicle glycoprotein 2